MTRIPATSILTVLYNKEVGARILRTTRRSLFIRRPSNKMSQKPRKRLSLGDKRSAPGSVMKKTQTTPVSGKKKGRSVAAPAPVVNKRRSSGGRQSTGSGRQSLGASRVQRM